MCIQYAEASCRSVITCEQLITTPVLLGDTRNDERHVELFKDDLGDFVKAVLFVVAQHSV